MVRVSLNMRELANVFSFFSLRISTYVARYVDDNVRWSIDLSLWLIAFFLHSVVQIQSVYHTCLFLHHRVFSFLCLYIMMLIWNAADLDDQTQQRERERESCLFFRVRAESKKISGMKKTYLCISDHCNKKRWKSALFSFIYFLRIRFYSHLVRLTTHILLRSSFDIIWR